MTRRETRNTGHVSTPPSSIARSVRAIVQRTRLSLSPWIQRRLQMRRQPIGPVEQRATGSAGSRLSQVDRRGKDLKTALSVDQTRSWVGRVQRMVERGRGQRPWDLGSVQPGMLVRFASEIVERFPPAGLKYQHQVTDTEAPDLVLVNGLETSPEAEEPEEDFFASLPPSPWSLGITPELQTGAPASPPPTGQRTMPAGRQPAPTASKRGRSFSRVEEIPRGKAGRPELPPSRVLPVPSGRAQEQAAADSAEPSPEPSEPSKPDRLPVEPAFPAISN